MVNSAASHKKAAKAHDLKDLIQLRDCFVEREDNRNHKAGTLLLSGSLWMHTEDGRGSRWEKGLTLEPSPGQGAPLVICCSQAGLVSGDPGAGAMPPREGMRTGSSGNHACGDG